MPKLTIEQFNWVRTWMRHWSGNPADCAFDQNIQQLADGLQYAPAPVDGDVIAIMCGTFQIAEGDGVKRMAAAAQVLQSRHAAELAEYKKALGPVTDEEWPYQEHAPVDLPRLAAPYITRQYADAIFEHRRALLEKKPEPVDPLHGLTSKYMPETTKAVGLSLHDELIAEAFNRGRSEPRA